MLKAKSLKAIHLFSPGPIGGAEKVVLAGLASLKNELELELWIIREERVASLSDSFIQLARDQGIPYRILTSRKLLDPMLWLELKRLIKQAGASILHTHGFRAALYGRLACPGQVKFIHTHHGKTAHTAKVRIYEKIEDIIMRFSDGVVAVSIPMQTTLRGFLPRSEKIYLIENPLTFAPSIALRPEGQGLVYIGRLSQEKGIQDLIEAMKRLKETSIKLAVVGDGPLYKWVEEQINGFDLHNNIKLLGFQKDVRPYLLQAAALILPSHREGLPLTLIEACCSGKPVIGTTVGGIPSLVTHGQNGILTDPSSPEKLAQCIRDFFENKKFYEEKAWGLKDGFLKRFDIQTWNQNTIKTYQTVLSQS